MLDYFRSRASSCPRACPRPVRARWRTSRWLHRPRQREIEDRHPCVRSHLHVVWLQVTVDHAVLVRVFQCSAICLAMEGPRLPVIRSATVGPPTRSMTTAVWALDRSRPWIIPIFGWLSPANTSASRWNQASHSRQLPRPRAATDGDMALQIRVGGTIHVPMLPVPTCSVTS